MLGVQQQLAICAAYCASNDDADCFDSVARSVPLEQHAEFVRLLNTLDALRLVRRARQVWQEGGTASAPVVSVEGDTVTLDGAPIGHLLTWYRTALPQETQARIAYDSLIDRFLAHLAATHKIIALSVNDLAVQVFTPLTADAVLEMAWQEFVQVAFSRAELEKSFVLLMNSIKLTNRGFGAVEFPIVTPATAEIQAAFYLATLEQRVIYGSEEYKAANTRYQELRRRHSEAQKKNQQSRVAEIEIQLTQASAQRAAALAANRARLEEAIRELGTRIPSDKLVRLRQLATHFNVLARNQFSYGTVIARTGNPNVKSTRTYIEDMVVSLANAVADFNLSCPLETEAQLSTARDTGDRQSGVCYVCGRPLEGMTSGKRKRGSAPALTANRFILAAPSQRLQSGTGQDQPTVCRECATVAIACPVKLTEGGAIVRLSMGEENDQIATDYLRMLTLGELNLVAGKYLLLKCTETVQMQRNGRTAYVPISEPMGMMQYALVKIATTLPRDTLRNCRTWLVTNNEQELPTLWMGWLNYLQEIFNLRLTYHDEKSNSNKANKAAFEAVRLVQKEEVLKAIYILITASEQEATKIWWRAADGQARPNFAAAQLLEDLRRDHAELLKKERDMSEKAVMFQHVAALTGLAQAFCYAVEREAKRQRDRDPENEVKKLIEEVTDPFQFAYRTARNQSEQWSAKWATMYNSGDNYFCFGQAKQLLENLGVDFSKRAEESKALFAKLAAAKANGQPVGESPETELPRSEGLAVCLDDIANAYTWLFSQPAYDSEKKQKDLTTELRLSLVSKFPQYFGK